MGDRDRDIFGTANPSQGSEPERSSDRYEDIVGEQNREQEVDYFEQYIASLFGNSNEPVDDEEPQQRPQREMITGEDPWSTAYVNPPPGVEPEKQYWEPPYSNARFELPRVMPKYTVNDPLNILNNMSSAQLVALEQEFVNAGYIEEEEMVGGNRASMIGTFTSLVLSADFNRVTWDEQLQGDVNRYEQWKLDNPEEGEKSWRQLNPFVAPVYLAPDYATLAQKAKETVRGELGRDVTSAEMNLLTGFLGEASRDQWKANEYDTELASWEARARAQETESSQSAGTVQGVDALARYGEMFEDRFAGELEHRERVDTLNRKETNLFGSIDTISRMTS